MVSSTVAATTPSVTSPPRHRPAAERSTSPLGVLDQHAARSMKALAPGGPHDDTRGRCPRSAGDDGDLAAEYESRATSALRDQAARRRSSRDRTPQGWDLHDAVTSAHAETASSGVGVMSTRRRSGRRGATRGESPSPRPHPPQAMPCCGLAVAVVDDAGGDARTGVAAGEAEPAAAAATTVRDQRQHSRPSASARRPRSPARPGSSSRMPSPSRGRAGVLGLRGRRRRAAARRRHHRRPSTAASAGGIGSTESSHRADRDVLGPDPPRRRYGPARSAVHSGPPAGGEPGAKATTRRGRGRTGLVHGLASARGTDAADCCRSGRG